MKHIILAVLFSLAIPVVHAQEEVYSSTGKSVERIKQEKKEEEKGFDRQKLIFGGGVIFGIGGGITNLGATPVVGYRFTDRFSAGVGLGYQYLSVRNGVEIFNPNTPGITELYPLRYSIYSGSVWGRFVVWNNIFIQAEPEMNLFTLRTPYYDISGSRPFPLKKREQSLQVPRILVGGGIRQPISERISLVAVILYDVLQDERSPFSNIDFRVGVNVGF